MNKNIIKYLLLLVVAFVLSCGEVDPFEDPKSSISSSSQNANISSSSSQNVDVNSSSSKNTNIRSSSSQNANVSSSSSQNANISSSSSQNANVSSSSSQNANISSSSLQDILDVILETGIYTAKDSVAAYIYLFHKLPSNYVSKATGQTLYETETGNTFSKWNFNPWTLLGVMIGGDIFYNNEGLLPSQNSYQECDVDYHDSSRGTKRLIYTLNGIIYYTANHYESFAKVY